jgi:uncharacterized membrane protein (DUF2068 family)
MNRIHAPAVPAPSHRKENWRERDQIIEIIAIYKFIKVAGLLAIDFGIIKLLQPATAHRIQSWILALSESDAHPHILHGLVLITSLTPRRIEELGVVVLFYAVLYMIEGLGLWFQSRWAEDLTIVATGMFIPLEIYEVVQRVTVPRVGALIVNIGAVVYLAYRLRHENERVRIV